MNKCLIFTIIIASTLGGGLLAKEIVGRPRQGDREDWPKVTVRLSEQGKLREIFDSGLRPYRFPGLESGLLEAKHFLLSIQIGERNPLPEIPVEYSEIRVYSTGELSKLEFTTPQLTFVESEEIFRPWLALSSRTEEDLGRFFNAVRESPQFWRTQNKDEMISRGCSVNWNGTVDSSVGYRLPSYIYFMPTFSSHIPLRIRLGFSWAGNHPLNGARNYRRPIPPPFGYEGVSMEAPENYGPDSPSKSSIDARMDQIIRERGLEPVRKDSNDNELKTIPKRLQGGGTKQVSNDKSDDAESSWPLIIAIIILVGATFYWGLRKWVSRRDL